MLRQTIKEQLETPDSIKPGSGFFKVNAGEMIMNYSEWAHKLLNRIDRETEIDLNVEKYNHALEIISLELELMYEMGGRDELKKLLDNQSVLPALDPPDSLLT